MQRTAYPPLGAFAIEFFSFLQSVGIDRDRGVQLVPVAALQVALATLTPRDRFNVIEFNSEARALFPSPVAVTTDMLITTFLTFFVIRYRWKYPLWLCIAATGTYDQLMAHPAFRAMALP